MTPHDPMTEVATSASRASKANFLKALFAAIKENSAYNYGQLLNRLQLTDNTFAALMNCTLDLDGDDVVDRPYVKRFRQRECKEAQ